MQYPVPYFKEIPYLAPEKRFAQINPNEAVWLDSANYTTKMGRYSYIAFEPIDVLVLKNGKLNDKALNVEPTELLKSVIRDNRLNKIEGLPPFQGGLAGFFSYDFGWYLEDLPNLAKDDMQYEDWILGVYDLVISFDHTTQKSWLVSSGAPLQGNDQLKRAKQRFDYAMAQLTQAPKLYTTDHIQVDRSQIDSTHSKASYEKMVQQTIDYILAGDIFEANVTQRFKAEYQGCPLQLYYKLRQVNPAPFAALLNFKQMQLLSASPERFVQVNDGLVETRPIKGTIKRSVNPQKDAQLGQQLVESEKDRAENIMIVDLMRNDLSRVCKPHSVKVPQLCGLESFATVHHLVSSVEGTLKDDKDAVDLLASSFPGGSITGAPKLRAMEIIETLEPYKRGPYCGSIGFLAFNGDMDLNIIIRTFALKDNYITFGAGGAITADSSCEGEFDESLAKAKAMIATLTN